MPLPLLQHLSEYDFAWLTISTSHFSKSLLAGVCPRKRPVCAAFMTRLLCVRPLVPGVITLNARRTLLSMEIF